MRRLTRSWAVRAAVVLGTLALGGGLLHGTVASFTSPPQNLETQIGVGTVALDDVGGDLVFDSTPLAPGDTATASVRLRATSSLPSDVALHRTSEASTAPHGCAIADALTLGIVEDLDGDPATTGDRRTLVDGQLTSAPADVALGRFAPDERRTYEVTLRFVPQGGAGTGTDAGANDNCFQGSVERQRFSWTAVEAGA